MNAFFKEAYSLVTSSYITLILAIIIIVLNVLLVYMLISEISFKKTFSKTARKVKNGLNYLDTQSKDNLLNVISLQSQNDYKIKLNFFESIDLVLIERSNIKRYIPFFNIYTLILGILGSFIGVFPVIYRIFNSIITSALLSSLICFLPVAILDTMGKYNTNKIREVTTDFLSILSNYLDIKNDLIYALEKSIEITPEPLSSYVKSCVIQIQNGIDIEVALDLLSYKVNIRQFYNTTLNLKQALKCKGDISILVKRLEDEASKIEKEFVKRKMENWLDQIAVNIMMILSIFVIYYNVIVNDKLKTIYIHTAQGRAVLNITAILFAVGFWLSLRIKKFDY